MEALFTVIPNGQAKKPFLSSPLLLVHRKNSYIFLGTYLHPWLQLPWLIPLEDKEEWRKQKSLTHSTNAQQQEKK